MKKQNKKFKKYLLAGILLIALSALIKDIPKHPFLITAPGAVNFLGIILICEAITKKLKGFSLSKTIFTDINHLAAFITVVIANAILLDGIAKYLGKLWIYPYWNTIWYLVLIIPSFFIYWLVIAESYLAIKFLLDKLIKGRRIIYRSFSFEKYLYGTLGAVGIISLILSLIFILSGYLNQRLPFWVNTEVNNNSESYVVGLKITMLIFLGFWFLFEYIEYRRGRGSLIKDIVHSYFIPLIAIAIGATVTALVMEFHNALVDGWAYTNWPYSNIQIYGLPVLVFVTWPLQYITFLSLFRILSPKQSLEVWRGDLIS